VADPFRYALILGDGREQLSRLLVLALLYQRESGHLAGRPEPWLAGLGEWLEPGDHLFGLEVIELDRGFANQRRVTIRLRQAAVARDRIVDPRGGLGIVLLERERSASELGGSAD